MKGLVLFTAFLLGKSYVGMRAEDILVCARWFSSQALAGKPGPVNLLAVGNVSIPALHAAALENNLFKSVTLENCIDSWSMVVKSHLTSDQLLNTVHGALRSYDLPELRKTLGDKLTSPVPPGTSITGQNNNPAALSNLKNCLP
jgi:hypothetical protein